MFLKLESLNKETYDKEYVDLILEQWKTCVEMANSNTEKRTNSNSIFIAINAALFTVVTFALDCKSILLSIIGVIVCILWLFSISSYQKLSSVKYHIINEIEEKLPLAPYTYEWEKLKHEYQYIGLTKIEKLLPWVFLSLYVLSIIWPIANFILNCIYK